MNDRDRDCTGTPGTPDPGSAGGTTVHADRSQYLWRAYETAAGVVAAPQYTTRRSILSASDRSRPQWVIRAWGQSLEEVAAQPPTPASPDRILGGLASAPIQIVIGISTGNVRLEVVLDLSGDVVYNVPPTNSLTVDALLPSNSAQVSIPGGQLVSSALLPGPGSYIHALVNVTAWPVRSPIERSRNRCSSLLNVPAGVTPAFVRIPSGAQRVTLYDGPYTLAGLAPALFYQWVGFVDPAGVTTYPIGELTGGIPQVVPAMATAIMVTPDPLSPARVCAVFEVE